MIDLTVISGSLDSHHNWTGAVSVTGSQRGIRLFLLPILEKNVFLFVGFTSFHRLLRSSATWWVIWWDSFLHHDEWSFRISRSYPFASWTPCELWLGDVTTWNFKCLASNPRLKGKKWFFLRGGSLPGLRLQPESIQNISKRTQRDTLSIFNLPGGVGEVPQWGRLCVSEDDCVFSVQWCVSEVVG